MSDLQLRCHYFDSGRCRSCRLIDTPYDSQLRTKEARCRALLPQVSEAAWLPSFSAGDRGFRNRVKLVVGGTASGPVTLGILGPDGQGIDLRECQIQAPAIARVISTLAAFIEETGLEPYDVPARRGELKFVHITQSPDEQFMLRFVVRSQHGLEVLRSRLNHLRQLITQAAVISVNLLPEHKAVLEGEREELLFGQSLQMRLGTSQDALTLHLRPQSFFQTNTSVARELYSQVASWMVKVQPVSIWDLYCGVGGFALHCALALAGAQQTRECEVSGVELSEAAIESARRSSIESKLAARFIAADATEFALAAARHEIAEAIIVNPPRRGIGDVLANWLEMSGARFVVYSSCNPESLARDLANMPSYRAEQARLFDMFPHTEHLEVAVLLARRS